MNDLNTRPHLTNNHEEDEIDLRELLGTVLNRKWSILLLTSIFTLLAVVYALGVTPIYKADSLLQVEAQKAAIPGIEELTGLGGDEASVGTELEIIKSRKILGQAIEKLKLDISASPKRVRFLGNLSKRFYSPDDTHKFRTSWNKLNEYLRQFAWGNETILVDRLSVPDYLLNQRLELTVRDNNEFDITFKDHLLLKGKVNQASSSTSTNGTISIFVANIDALPGTKFNVTKLSQLNAVNNLQNKITAAEKGKKTGIITLALEGSDKELIVKTLDLISTTYLEQNKSRSSEEASNALKFLDEQIIPVKEEAESAEARLKKYRTSNKTADMSLETQAVLNVVTGIDTEIQKISLKRDEFKQKYTPNHPVIQTLNAQESKLKAQKSQTLSKISKLPETQQNLLKLERDYKVSNEIYLELLNNIQEFKIAKASNVGNVYILDTAVVYDKPVKPKKSLIVALGALLGVMTGTLLAFISKALHQFVTNPEKIEETLGMPVYATVPFTKGVKLTGGLQSKIRKQKTLLALHDSTDPAIESLRSLRTSLHFALLEAKNNIVMITGPSPGIGKSFISSNLAAVIAASEQRVLLIDADMRKGYIHSLFNKAASPGLSDLISRKSTFKDTIQTIQIEGDSLDVIFRGQTPPNPSELLMHTNFAKILDAVSKKYDLVIIDTPPIHAVTDPSIIGMHAGVVFMVLRHNAHSMKEIQHAVTRLSHTGVETKGFIFNGYVTQGSGYGYGGSYYSNYKSDTDKQT